MRAIALGRKNYLFVGYQAAGKAAAATRPVDFRKGHDGLAAVVQDQLGFDPHSGLVVIFRSRRGDRAKILFWDGSGLVMICKRLEQGSFTWPAVQDGVMRLSRAQFEALFEGLDWRRVMARRGGVPSGAGGRPPRRPSQGLPQALHG